MGTTKFSNESLGLNQRLLNSKLLNKLLIRHIKHLEEKLMEFDLNRETENYLFSQLDEGMEIQEIYSLEKCKERKGTMKVIELPEFKKEENLVIDINEPIILDTRFVQQTEKAVKSVGSQPKCSAGFIFKSKAFVEDSKSFLLFKFYNLN